MPAVGEPLRRVRHGSRRSAPVVGFERPPRDLLVALRAAAHEAAAGAATLALLEAGPRSCNPLLSELDDRAQRAQRAAGEVRDSDATDARLYVLAAAALSELARRIHDTGSWWCRTAGCAADLNGVAGALRDATRELAGALDAYPDGDADVAVVAVHRRVSEGRRLARRARAAAIDGGELREVLGRLSAIAAAERALGSTGRAASGVRRLSAG
jgi:hypothetical protein